MCSSAFRVSGPPHTGPDEEGGVATKPLSLDRWGCVFMIALRSVQGFGLPLTLHKPTDRQRNIHLYSHFNKYRLKLIKRVIESNSSTISKSHLG